MLTAIGGGMTRDVLLSEIPTVLRADLFAVAALAGAVVVVIGAVTAPLDRGDDCRRAPLFWAPVHGHSPRLASAGRRRTRAADPESVPAERS